MISNIRVEMLGGLSVWADGVPVLDGSTKINKPWQVFCFLVLNRGAASSASRLIGALWADENLTDPANVLKNTVYALRKEFKDVKGTQESPILFENGGYLCNPAIHFEVDAELFEKKAKAAQNPALAGEAGEEERARLLGEAIDLYQGDLLPQLENEVWVMPLALYYKQIFGDSVEELCGLYYRQGRYNQLLAVATGANRLDPMEESYYTYMFRALYALEMYRAIIPAYHKTARIFSEELGISPGQEIRDIYAAASEQVDVIEQDIMIIKNDLREVASDSSTLSGPLYCTYDVFKYLYQMVARSSERSGGSVMVVLLSLQQKDGGQPPPKIMSAAMNQIKTLILGGLLRKSDTVARYSKSQFIIMLSVDKAAGAQYVIDRIRDKCEPFLAPNNIEIEFATTEMDAVS